MRSCRSAASVLPDADIPLDLDGPHITVVPLRKFGSIKLFAT
jgi:hypothetical protein